MNSSRSHPLCANLSHLGILLSTDFVPVEGMFSALMLGSIGTGCGGKGRSMACKSTSGARGAGTCESSGFMFLRH